MSTQAEILAVLIYDQGTGVFTRRRSGKITGTLDKSNGYLIVGIGQDQFYAHRLAWTIMTGATPRYIDHVDGDKTNNRWANLREASGAQNCQNRRRQTNNKSGLKGVSLCKETGRWRADIRVDGHAINLGRAASPEEAAALYARAAEKYFGEFARTD